VARMMLVGCSSVRSRREKPLHRQPRGPLVRTTHASSSFHVVRADEMGSALVCAERVSACRRVFDRTREIRRDLTCPCAELLA
jgi:hypothetical protein